MIRIPRLLVFLLVLASPASRGCDLCAVYSATRAQGLAPTVWTASVAVQSTDFGVLRDEGHRVADPAGQWVASTIAQLVVGRGLNDWLSLQVNVPLIQRTFRRVQDQEIVRDHLAGLGDASLLLRGSVVRHEGANATIFGDLLAGAKFPTGGTSRLREELDESGAVVPTALPPSAVHGHDLTPGSGSTDALIGTNWYGRYRRLFGTASVQYSFRQRGKYDYRFANDLTWEVAPGAYLWLGHQHTLAFQAVVSGEKKGLDDLAGAPADDTGVTAVYAGPRLSYTLGGGFSAQFGVDLPVSMHNTAQQLTTDHRLRGVVSWNF